jgi:hypothetical protein
VPVAQGELLAAGPAQRRPVVATMGGGAVGERPGRCGFAIGQQQPS